jgi:hypothetical protein
MLVVGCCPPKNEKSPPNLSVRQGQIGGWEFAMLSFPRWLLGAFFKCCQLPDAILHGKRSLRPRSRAVQRLASAEFRVRLFSLLGLVVAPPACKPDPDTSVNSYPRLYLLAPGQLPILSERSPGATGLASSLSGCFSFSGQRCVFHIADVLKGFHGSCL